MRHLVIYSVCLLLASCATPGAKVAGTDTSEHAQQLTGLESWTVRGGLGIWTDDENLSARINWQQQRDNFDIRLNGPGGLGSMRLLSIDSQASLQRGTRQPVTGDSAALLLQQALGLRVAIPVGQLSLWIRGLPGNASATRYSQDGLLESLEFRDAEGTLWSVGFRRYALQEDLPLPALITARGGPYNVRLVLKDWMLEDTPGNADTGNLPQTAPATTAGRLKVPGR